MEAVTCPSDRASRATLTRSARIAGAEAVWREWPADGDEREGEAPAIVLVHGFRGTHIGLWPVAAQLPEVRFIAPDLPGFGDSSPLPREHTLDAYAQWLEAFLEDVDPEGRAVVLGHSFGSLIVARRPEALGGRRIVLVNPIAAPALEGPSRIMTQLAILYYRAGAALPEPIGRALLAHPLITRVMSEVMARTRRPGLRRWIHAQHDAWFSAFSDRDTLLEAFRASVSDSVTAHAEQLPAGTVLAAGEQDAIAPLEAQLRLRDRMRDGRLHVISGVGHLVHYERPVALARILRTELGLPGPGLGDGADAAARLSAEVA